MNNDLISRSALLKELDEYNEFAVFDCEAIKDLINNAQSVDAIVNTVEVRPQGKWIDHSLENLLWGHNECPFCHKRSNRGAHFCQYCGARLEEAEKDA